MIKAERENQKLTIEISGQYGEVRYEMLHIGEAVRKIPDRDKRDELVLAFVMGALGDPSLTPTEPGFEELIHSDEEG